MMGKARKEKGSFWKKAGEAALEILVELAATVAFLAIGAGIMILLGNRDAVETVDPELLVLLGALVVLAAFGVVFAIVAIRRKRNKKNDP